jgi:hypothetical protein
MRLKKNKLVVDKSKPNRSIFEKIHGMKKKNVKTSRIMILHYCPNKRRHHRITFLSWNGGIVKQTKREEI